MSGAIVNRSYKTAVLGLGGLGGQSPGPCSGSALPPPSRLSSHLYPYPDGHHSPSWRDCLVEVQASIYGWLARKNKHLQQRKVILET
jgi:hypothetical protein